MATENGSCDSPPPGQQTNGEMPEESQQPEHEETAEGSSSVLHLRRLPLDVTDAEVAMLAVPFGGLQNMVLTKKTGQALLEMPSVEAAQMMLDFYSTLAKPFLRRPNGPQHIAIQFSRYPKLSTNGGSAQLYAAINQANQMAALAADNGPRSVLRVQVDAYPLQVPLSHSLFHQIFARFGPLKRIIVYTVKRNPPIASHQHLLFQPQALIEFESPLSAHVAKLQLHNCPFSPFGGHLLVDFSRQNSLEVRHENTLCRDYTVHPLTEMEQLTMGLATMSSERLYPVNNSDFQQPQRCFVNGGDGLMRRQSTQSFVYPPQQHQGIIPLMHTQHPDRLILPPNASPVLIVSQLNPELVTPDVLFTLFGVYGDVVRVKVMFSKRDTALVQFVDASQAALALENLNGCPLFGQALQCNFSRHLHIKMPPPSGEAVDETATINGEAMTKDYTDSGLHRFRRVNSRNYANIYAPSCVLHVSNMPPDWTAEQLAEAFTEHQHPALHTRLLQSDRRMALLQFGSVEQAVAALVRMHNVQLDGPDSKNRIRVCFSKFHAGSKSISHSQQQQQE